MITCSIYCRVIDNFGDAGIAWRLARTLVTEKNWQVTLIIDDIDTLSKIVPEIDSTQRIQSVCGLTVERWDEIHESASFCTVSDVTIEAFSCFLPQALEAAIAREGEKRPISVIALDYLTAEAYAESSHGLVSPHPRYGYRKHFFFPGFTDKTGGLIREANLEKRHEAFFASNARESLLKSIGADPDAPFSLFFFTYPTIAVARFAQELAADRRPLQIIAAPGEASARLRTQLQQLNAPHITFIQAPMFAQAEFDRILLASDVVLVRGEDSTVRAQLSGTPLLWTLYPQSEDTHLVKLQAFSQLYCGALSAQAASVWSRLSAGLNGSDLPQGCWKAYRDEIGALRQGAQNWKKYLFSSSSLTDRLCAMVQAQLAGDRSPL